MCVDFSLDTLPGAGALPAFDLVTFQLSVEAEEYRKSLAAMETNSAPIG
jgi:hypothetical protein